VEVVDMMEETIFHWEKSRHVIHIQYTPKRVGVSNKKKISRKLKKN